MENTNKSGPESAWTAPEGAGGDAQETAEASENAARSAPAEAAAARPLAQLGAVLRSAAPQAPGPSDPRRRPFPDPGDRAEAPAAGAARPVAARAPSPAPSFPPRGLHSGLTSLPGAGRGRRANRPEDIQDEAQGASGASSGALRAPGPDASPGPALPAPIGAPAPADGGAPSD